MTLSLCCWIPHLPLLLLLLHLPLLIAFASPSIPPPPPISMPVWSFACPSVNDQDDTSMNIVTFATPVSVAAPKLWIVSLYTNTMTRDSFLRSGQGVLQLLTPSMKDLVPVLGKRSGYEAGYSKRSECRKIGYEWIKSDSDFIVEQTGKLSSIDLLPGCASYVQLKLLRTMEAGDHDVALCEVVSTGVSCDDDGPPTALDPSTALYTAQLRQEGII